MRTITIALALTACLATLSARADGGGGGGDNIMQQGPGPAAGAPPAAAGGAGAAGGGAGRGNPDGTSTLPGGTQIALSGPAGNRDVTVTTPEGKKYAGKHIRTSYNRQTGITSVWIRNADGSRTGVHTDRQGNQSVSNHSK